LATDTRKVVLISVAAVALLTALILIWLQLGGADAGHQPSASAQVAREVEGEIDADERFAGVELSLDKGNEEEGEPDVLRVVGEVQSESDRRALVEMVNAITRGSGVEVRYDVVARDSMN